MFGPAAYLTISMKSLIRRRAAWIAPVLGLGLIPIQQSLNQNAPSVRFVDVLAGSGIGFKHHFFPSEQGDNYRMNQYDHGSGVLVADVNGDGLMDIYLLDFLGPNALYINKGNFKFEDIARKAGVDMPEDVSVGGSFGDYDNDGNIDLYVTTYQTGNRLFRNNGDGTFTDVTQQSGLSAIGWNGDVTVGDYDLDGSPDIYVTQMFGASRLFHNNGNGTFTDVTRKALGRTSWGAMGALFFDANNDGYPDLYVVDMHSDMWTHADPTGVVDPKVKYDTPRGKMAEGWQVVTKPEQTKAKWVLFGNTFFVNRHDGTFLERSEGAGLENFWPWG